MRFVARDELFTWRLLGPYLRITGHIEVCPERGSWSYRQLLRSARAVMQSGDSLAIFPQGGLLGIEIACMSGAFALARFLKRPVLPVALTGTHRVWEYPYSPRLRYGERVSMRVLEPVSVDDMLSREVDEVCQDVCQRLKQTALSGTMAPPRRFVPSRDGYWDGYAYCIDPMFPDLAADIEHHRHVTETRSLLRAQPDQ
jgi:1-acyl-sn-glycerol-3-phosphate acyltransferase